ncbi:MotA/TolQ/ExbB proton channel family protein [Psychromonas aquatilis]|uniref:MotA/TolQ/ExbB proton channel family protein n=1 Tax=Psychromonas aquatilis TaxID=2005072 RepID=A0ABU9GNH2_9GAMM
MFNNIWHIATGVPLLLCSVIAISLIIEKAIFLLRQKDITQVEYENILEMISTSKLEQAIDELINLKPFYCKALLLMKKEQHSDKDVRDEQVSTLMVMFNSRLRQRVSGLVTVASLAPMLGLLGTIIGLMRAFQKIGEHAGPVEPSIVANGLWQALSTTAAGLVIAVFCVLAHAIFTSKIKKMLTRSQFLLNSLSQLMQQRNKKQEKNI